MASLQLAAGSRPQEGEAGAQESQLGKMMEKLEKFKAENEALKAYNSDLELNNFKMYTVAHQKKEPAPALVETMPGAGSPLYSTGYQPVADYGFGPPPALFGPASAQAWEPKEQSLLQNNAASFNAGGAALSSSRERANYASASRHEHFDTFLSHMETRQRNDDIARALNTLQSALGDGSGNGKLAKDMTQAVDDAEQVQSKIGEWDGISKKTMAVAPEMAQAVQESAEILKKEHESLSSQVSQHGRNVLEKFDQLEGSIPRLEAEGAAED